MFYSQFILAKKGPLGTIWIAAHLERKLRKNQVADTDIGVSVDSILSPEVPIALRLSSHLLLGVVRIYSRKVNYLFDDCSEALLKVKQAFRSTAVDLPPEESTAPYHSITLPETFDLDDFELPDNENFQGNYVDHHISTKEQITLQDTMEGVVFSTSQFGLDEQFGDGDASQISFDLDEDLFLDKVAAPRHTGVMLDSKDDPQASVQPMTSLDNYVNNAWMIDTSEAMPVNGHGEQLKGLAANNEIIESAQAPSTPGLIEEPNLSNMQMGLACDDHMELENYNSMEFEAREAIGNSFSKSDHHGDKKCVDGPLSSIDMNLDCMPVQENDHVMGEPVNSQANPQGDLPSTSKNAGKIEVQNFSNMQMTMACNDLIESEDHNLIELEVRETVGNSSSKLDHHGHKNSAEWGSFNIDMNLDCMPVQENDHVMGELEILQAEPQVDIPSTSDTMDNMLDNPLLASLPSPVLTEKEKSVSVVSESQDRITAPDDMDTVGDLQNGVLSKTDPSTTFTGQDHLEYTESQGVRLEETVASPSFSLGASVLEDARHKPGFGVGQISEKSSLTNTYPLVPGGISGSDSALLQPEISDSVEIAGNVETCPPNALVSVCSLKSPTGPGLENVEVLAAHEPKHSETLNPNQEGPSTRIDVLQQACDSLKNEPVKSFFGGNSSIVVPDIPSEVLLEGQAGHKPKDPEIMNPDEEGPSTRIHVLQACNSLKNQPVKSFLGGYSSVVHELPAETSEWEATHTLGASTEVQAANFDGTPGHQLAPGQAALPASDQQHEASTARVQQQLPQEPIASVSWRPTANFDGTPGHQLAPGQAVLPASDQQHEASTTRLQQQLPQEPIATASWHPTENFFDGSTGHQSAPWQAAEPASNQQYQVGSTRHQQQQDTSSTRLQVPTATTSSPTTEIFFKGTTDHQSAPWEAVVPVSDQQHQDGDTRHPQQQLLQDTSSTRSHVPTVTTSSPTTDFFDSTTEHQPVSWEAVAPPSDHQHQVDTARHLHQQSQDTSSTRLQAATITTSWPPTATFFDGSTGHHTAPWQAAVLAGDQQHQDDTARQLGQRSQDTSSTRPQAPSTAIFFDGSTEHQPIPWKAAVPASDQQHQADTARHLHQQSQDTISTSLQVSTTTTSWPPTVNFFDGTTGHQLAPWQAVVSASDQQHQADTPRHLQPQSQDTGSTGLQARTITTNWSPTANIFDATTGHPPAPCQAAVQASDQQCQAGSPKYQLQNPQDTSITRLQAPTTTTSWRQTGEGYRATDMGQPSSDVNQLLEPNSCQYVDAGRRKLDEQLANAKNTVENYFSYADLPAPEKMLSVPEGCSHLGNNFLLESTPGKEVTMHGEENGTGVQNITGNKRSYMESILTTQSLNSVELFEKSRSERTTGSVPDDDDLLSSILVGRRSSILKMKPTPPPSEIMSVKRRRTAPRASASKRKVFMDDTMVLHGDIIRQHLTNTEDIRRVRKKAPCTRPEIWMIQNQFLEDEIFSEPIFTGTSSELICSLGQRYDPSIIRVSQNDESIALFGAAKNRELPMTPNVINETEPERIIESEITRNDGKVQFAETVVQTEVQHLDNDTQMQLNANATMPELRTLHPETDGITEPIIARNDGEAQPAMAIVQTKDQHNYIDTQMQINSNTIIPELKSSLPETEGITEPIIASNDGEAQPANTFVQTAEQHNYNDTQMQMNANTVIPEPGTLQPEHMGKIAEMEFARGGSAVANAEDSSVALGIGLSSPVDLVSVDICSVSTDSVFQPAHSDKPSGSPQIDVACLVPDQKLESQSVEKDASVVDLCIEKGVEPVEVSEIQVIVGTESRASFEKDASAINFGQGVESIEVPEFQDGNIIGAGTESGATGEIQVIVGTESCASFEKDASAINFGQGVESIEVPEFHDGNIIGAGTESGATGEFLLEENRGGLSVENRTDNPTDSVDLPLETVSPAIDLVVVTDHQAKEETAKIEEEVVNEATEKGYDGRDRISNGVCSQEPKTDCSLNDGQDASLNNVEKSSGQEAVPQDVRDAETASFDHADVEIHDDVESETVEHDTEFLNFDDDDDGDGVADDDYDDCMPCPEETRILENSGWSSRTRAVAKYLQTVFDKEADHGKKVIPLDNLLSGKTRKEASRMFFESLVLKTRDYIHVEQENPFDNIIIKPRVKLLKSEF